jgi:tRNA (mo5U34)-methyltransferase
MEILMNERRVLTDINRLAPWFHNLHLADAIQTCPNHHFGDFPNWKWQQLASHLPVNLHGWRVLDIGCNAGFYSFELARRGALVLGIDGNPHFLAQARWAAALLGLDDVCRFECRQVYDLARIDGQWDLVLFMGVFYHLRYPLLALDIVAEKVSRYLIFQSVAIGECGNASAPVDVDFQTLSALECPSWPQMAFVEHTFCHDATNWWIPNRAAVAGMLRSTGMRIEIAVDADTLICSPDGSKGARDWDRVELLAATGTGETNAQAQPLHCAHLNGGNSCTANDAPPARGLSKRHTGNRTIDESAELRNGRSLDVGALMNALPAGIVGGSDSK